MLPEEAVLKLYCAHFMLKYVRDLTFDPRSRAKPFVVNGMWQIMAACSCNPSIQQAQIN